MTSPLADGYEQASALVTAFSHGDEGSVTAILNESDAKHLALALAQMLWATTHVTAAIVGISVEQMWQRMTLAAADLYGNTTGPNE